MYFFNSHGFNLTSLSAKNQQHWMFLTAGIKVTKADCKNTSLK